MSVLRQWHPIDIWKDPVWSKVIAAGILALLSYVPVHSFLQFFSVPALAFFSAAVSLTFGLLLAFIAHIRKRTRTLVFLSAGGTCRDPMAKVIASQLLKSQKLKHRIHIRALGLGPLSKSEVSYAARYVIKELYGKDLLASHKPEILTTELASSADLILAMDQRLLLTPGKTLPKEKTFIFKEFFGLSGDISDPWPDGKDAVTIARYRECANELRDILTNNLDRLVKVLDV